MRRTDSPLLIVACLTTSLVAQERIPAGPPPNGPTFDVVSIRQNVTRTGGGGGVQGSRYTTINVNVIGLIMQAYQVPPERIAGAPDWTKQESYDVVAQAATIIAPGQLPLMVRGLLRNRFRLSARMETKLLPSFALVVARPGSLGPKLSRTAVNCGDAEAVAKARAAAVDGRPICAGRSNRGSMRLSGVTINALATALTAPAGRLITNQTGLDGRFDIELDWGTLDTPDGVSLFTAVEEQLGLRLQRTEAPFEMVVIDRIERPTEN